MWIRACALGLATALAAPASAQVFADASVASGFQPAFLGNIPGGGIAIADFDRNGHQDLFVTGYFEPNRLYFNQGDGSFQQVAAVNQTLPGSKCSVAAAADYDNDGWPDIYVGCRDQSNYLFRNLGGTGFENRMVPAIDHAPVGANSPRTDAVAWGDLDGNGLLDLFIGIWVDQDEPDLDNPDNLNRIMLQAAPDQWLNVVANYTGSERAKLARNTLAVTFSDLDRDGRTDIYVVNDKVRGNLLYRNLGPGCGGWCLAEVAQASGAAQTPMGMGVAVGDTDRDGDWELFFSSIDEQFFLRGDGLAPLHWQHQPTSALNHYGVGWGTIFADFDNDGWEDAYLAVGSGGFSTTSNQDQIYRNDRAGGFTSVTAQSGALVNLRTTMAASRVDFDRDGRLDLVVGHWNEGYRLYRNVQPNPGNWIGLVLEGVGAVNRDGIGALVEMRTADGARQLREVRAGESRGGNHELALHFGLGSQASAEFSVRWPDGTVENLGSLPAGQYHAYRQFTAPFLFANGFD